MVLVQSCNLGTTILSERVEVSHRPCPFSSFCGSLPPYTVPPSFPDLVHRPPCSRRGSLQQSRRVVDGTLSLSFLSHWSQDPPSLHLKRGNGISTWTSLRGRVTGWVSRDSTFPSSRPSHPENRKSDRLRTKTKILISMERVRTLSIRRRGDRKTEGQAKLGVDR